MIFLVQILIFNIKVNLHETVGCSKFIHRIQLALLTVSTSSLVCVCV